MICCKTAQFSLWLYPDWTFLVLCNLDVEYEVPLDKVRTEVMGAEPHYVIVN